MRVRMAGRHSCSSCLLEGNGAILGKKECDWEGSQGRCETMYKGDFAHDQSWCCQAWCYVNAKTCTAERQAQWGITLAQSEWSKDLYFSYDVCPDPWSGSGKSGTAFQLDGSRHAYFAQFTPQTCPYSSNSSTR